MIEQAEILVGGEAAGLPDSLLSRYGSLISNALATYPHTMLQFSAEDLMTNIQKGQAILAIDSHKNLLAFAQLWEYGENSSGQTIFEFGSWLSFVKGGFGTEVLLHAPTLAKLIKASSQVVAIVEQENTRAQGIIQILNGKEISLVESPIIKDPLGNFASMKIFDITNVDRKGLLASAFAWQLGVPFNRIPEWLSALYTTFVQGDQIERAIEYINFTIETKKGAGRI